MEKVCPQCERRYTADETFCPADRSTLRLVTPVQSDELIGTVIDDRYLIVEALGTGGMGKVYLGRHVMLDRKAAIKVLHRRYLDIDPDAVARFKRTASDASKIVNENVASIYDYGETHDGLVYLAMEYVPGPTIGTLQKREGPLAPTRVAHFVLEIAAALDATHERGIVHRDLKPDNIIITQDPSGNEVVKLIDFGIAKAIHGDGPQQAQGGTRVGMLIGTPYYMSPEQLSGQKIDRRSDVYALGLLTFTMLTGELAYDPNTPMEALLAERMGKKSMRLADALPLAQWPAGLQRVMEQAMHPDRDLRFATAGGFAVALATVVGVVSATAAGGYTPHGGVARMLTPRSVPAHTVDAGVPGSTAHDEQPAPAGAGSWPDAPPSRPMVVPRPELAERVPGAGESSRRWLIPTAATLAAIVLGGAAYLYVQTRDEPASTVVAQPPDTSSVVAAAAPPESTNTPTDGGAKTAPPPAANTDGGREAKTRPPAADPPPRPPETSSPAITVVEMRRLLARWNRQLSDPVQEASAAMADSTLTSLRTLEFLRWLPTVDDSALAYYVESQAYLAFGADDDVLKSCAVLEKSRAVGERSAYRKTFRDALAVCRSG